MIFGFDFSIADAHKYRIDLCAKPTLSGEISTAAFPIADIQKPWINFGFRHTAVIQVESLGGLLHTL